MCTHFVVSIKRWLDRSGTFIGLRWLPPYLWASWPSFEHHFRMFSNTEQIVAIVVQSDFAIGAHSHQKFVILTIWTASPHLLLLWEVIATLLELAWCLICSKKLKLFNSNLPFMLACHSDHLVKIVTHLPIWLFHPLRNESLPPVASIHPILIYLYFKALLAIGQFSFDWIFAHSSTCKKSWKDHSHHSEVIEIICTHSKHFYWPPRNGASMWQNQRK